jgi:hypothetical protein
MQYGYQLGLYVVYYSILQYIWLSVENYSIPQYITATSQQYGYQPIMSVVYYSMVVAI